LPLGAILRVDTVVELVLVLWQRSELIVFIVLVVVLDVGVRTAVSTSTSACLGQRWAALSTSNDTA